MQWAYRFLTYCAILPMLLYLWWRGRADPAYRQRWGERFGRADRAAVRRGGVVLHCASVGEVIAARPLIDLLLADPRFTPLTITCSTPTGSRMVRQDHGERVAHLYFPFDLRGAARRFLRRLQPRLVLLLERELWPNFLHQAQAMGVPVVLVNARLSAPSAAAYARWRLLMVPAIASLRQVCAEDAVTAARLQALGVPAHRIAITGNIKSDARLPPELPRTAACLKALLGERPVITAGSTHAGEDEALIDAFKDHLTVFPQTLLVLVPRHPERFATVAEILSRSGPRFVRHSLAQHPGPDTQVLLGDTMGELMLWYAIADACFVGGSLVPRGGHNPLEVLCLHKPLIAGPHTANFEQFYTALLAEGGMLSADDAKGVFLKFRLVLQNPNVARTLVAGGDTVYLRLAGASVRTLAQLEFLVGPPADAACGEPAIARDGRDTLWVDPLCFDPAIARPQDYFNPAWWRQRGDARKRSTGRGQVNLVSDNQRAYLLRHYHRGGLMARFSTDLFLGLDAARSRAMREFTLLGQLRAKGLRVPRACAARHARVALLWYRADILVAEIADATDVAHLLHRQRALASREWQAIGQAVRRLHEAQVWHADLNCHNLMLDTQGQAWIVDFDKCGFRAGEAWKQHNLERLLRSLRKELRLEPGFRWNEGDWADFLSGYAEVPSKVHP